MKRWFHIVIAINDRKSEIYSYFNRKGLHDVDSTLHYLLAGEVFQKLIEKYKMELWRFSRYKYEDEPNIFKFKAYISLRDFRDIKEDIRCNELIIELTNEMIIKPILDWPEHKKDIYSNERIGSDNDEIWDYTIKESWPYFINGVCKMWLNMIMVERGNIVRERYINKSALSNLFQLFSIYEEARERINKLWRDDGKHFAYHHTSAVFGYEYVRLMTLKENIFYRKSWKSKFYSHEWSFLYLRMFRYLRIARFLDKIFPTFRRKWLKGYIKL